MNIASSNLLVDFVKLGYGIGYVTELYVMDELKKGNLFELVLNNDTPCVDYGIISLKNNVKSSISNLFLEYLINEK